MKADEDKIAKIIAEGGEPTVVVHAPEGNAPDGALRKVSNAFRNAVAVAIGGTGTVLTAIGGGGTAILLSKVGEVAGGLVASGAVGILATKGMTSLLPQDGHLATAVLAVSTAILAGTPAMSCGQAVVAVPALISASVMYAGAAMTDIAVDNIAAKDAVGDRLRGWRDQVGIRKTMAVGEVTEIIETHARNGVNSVIDAFSKAGEPTL